MIYTNKTIKYLLNLLTPRQRKDLLYSAFTKEQLNAIACIKAKKGNNV